MGLGLFSISRSSFLSPSLLKENIVDWDLKL